MTEKVYSYTDVCHLANGWNAVCSGLDKPCLYVAQNCTDVDGPFIDKYEWINTCWQYTKRIYPKDVRW